MYLSPAWNCRWLFATWLFSVRGAGSPPPAPKAKDADTRAAEDALHRALGAPVEIVRRGRGGSVVIGFTSEDELQRLYEYLTQQRLGIHE